MHSSTNTRRLATRAGLLAFVAAILVVDGARADCSFDGLPGEGQPGVTGDLAVEAAVAWDPDGLGPEPELLVIGGGFVGAGDVLTFGLAAWDGVDWRTLG